MKARRRLQFPVSLHRNRRARVQSLRQRSGEVSDVVKGSNRRVVVVRSPDESIFEQAIFILRDDYLQTEREGSKRLLEEARCAAGAYMARLKGPRRRRSVRALLAAAGAAAVVIGWLAVRFGGVFF